MSTTHPPHVHKWIIAFTVDKALPDVNKVITAGIDLANNYQQKGAAKNLLKLNLLFGGITMGIIKFKSA